MRRAEGGAKIFGVFRVKNHDFTQKNHIFAILGGGTHPGSAPVMDRNGVIKDRNGDKINRNGAIINRN